MKLSVHHIRRLAGLGLVVAATAAPAAQAGHEDFGPRPASEISQAQFGEWFPPDGYQPQLQVVEDALSRWLRNSPDGYQPQLQVVEDALSRWLRNSPDGYQPQLQVVEAPSGGEAASVRPDDRAERFSPVASTGKLALRPTPDGVRPADVTAAGLAARNDYTHFGDRRALSQDAPRKAAPASAGREIEIDWLNPGILAGLVLTGTALMGFAAFALRRRLLVKH